MRSNEIDRVQQRVRRYWYEDGLTEIVVGGIFVLLALLFFGEGLAPAGVLPPSFSAFAFPVLLIVLMVVARPVLAAAKGRLTYPRTGYVAYPRKGPRGRLITGVVGGVLAALIVILLSALSSPFNWPTLLQGVAIGAFLLYMAHTMALPRFYVLALISAFAGAGAAFSGLGETLGSAAQFATIGVALIVSGSLILRAYLSGTSRPDKV
jgi:hypothetical protein